MTKIETNAKRTWRVEWANGGKATLKADSIEDARERAMQISPKLEIITLCLID
jgi:hypothetical protein